MTLFLSVFRIWRLSLQVLLSWTDPDAGMETDDEDDFDSSDPRVAGFEIDLDEEDEDEDEDEDD